VIDFALVIDIVVLVASLLIFALFVYAAIKCYVMSNKAKFEHLERLKAAREGLRQAWYRQGGRK